MVSLVCLILILLSLKFYILEDITYHQNILDSALKTYQTPDFLSFKGIIQKYNSQLIAIDNFYKKEVYLNQALKAVLDTDRPTGLYFTNISIEKNVENKALVALSGFSNSRDNLLIFKNSLEHSQKITNVYFPPDSWVKPVNVNFSITLEYENQYQK